MRFFHRKHQCYIVGEGSFAGQYGHLPNINEDQNTEADNIAEQVRQSTLKRRSLVPMLTPKTSKVSVTAEINTEPLTEFGEDLLSSLPAPMDSPTPPLDSGRATTPTPTDSHGKVSVSTPVDGELRVVTPTPMDGTQGRASISSPTPAFTFDMDLRRRRQKTSLASEDGSSPAVYMRKKHSLQVPSTGLLKPDPTAAKDDVVSEDGED